MPLFLFDSHYVVAQHYVMRGHGKGRRQVISEEELEKLRTETSFDDMIVKSDEHIFTDKFFDDIDFVISAVDNVHARTYIDSKCVFHKSQVLGVNKNL